VICSSSTTNQPLASARRSPWGWRHPITGRRGSPSSARHCCSVHSPPRARRSRARQSGRSAGSRGITCAGVGPSWGRTMEDRCGKGDRDDWLAVDHSLPTMNEDNIL
jgi:hypothetical protein